MKQWVILGLVLFSIATLSSAQPAVSQSVFASAGHSIRTSGISISSTVGEPIIYGGANENYAACQGFQSGQSFITTQAIDFAEGVQQVSLYPNPVRDQLTISWEMPGDYHIQLFNAAGQMVITQFVRDASTMQIDMSQLPAGLYAISFFSKNNTRHFAGWVAHLF